MKIKKFISLLAATAMTLTVITGAMTASASEVANGTCGDGITWTLDSDGKLTISGNGAMASPNIANETKNVAEGVDATKLFIESKLGDYTDIYTYKKEHLEDIKEVEIKEGVTAIGFCAFYKMPNLVTVVLPKTISEFKGVGYDSGCGTNHHFYISAFASCAFAECTKLKNLTLAEGMTAIGSIAFYGCTSLESVRIPSTILYEYNKQTLEANNGWGPYSFMGCTSLKNITLPEGLTVIGAQVFRDTAVESVVIPSTVKEWNDGVDAHSIKTYEEPQLPYASNCAFANCKKLSSVTFNNGITKIGNSSFVGCSSLSRVVIPNSVTEMTYSFAFSGLQEAYIEDGAQILPSGSSNSYFQYAFYNCTNLKKLEIPEGVILAYTNPQWCTGCTSLTDIYRHGMESDFPSGVVSDSVTIHCDYGSKIYKSSAYLNKKIEIEEDIENALKELNTAVLEAEKYAEKDYTPESYGALKTALENAKKFDDKSTGVLPIEWAADDIMTAIEGLEEKKDEPSSSDPSDSSNPTDNSSDPSNSSDNNNQSQSPNTPATPSTSAPTTATPKPTTPPTVTATAAKPAKVKAVKLKAKKKKLNVSWKKVSGATGYEIQYATNNKFTKGKKTVTVKKNKVTLKRLKSKKKYFVKVRAYKLANGRKYFGKWSKVVKKKVK